MTAFEEFSSQLPPRINRGDVEKLLRAIISESSPWEWFTRASIPFPFAVAILRRLRDGSYASFDGDGTLAFTASGSRLLEELAVRPAPYSRCPACAGSGSDWSALVPVYDRYLKLFEARPRGARAELDQGAMTPESLFRRIALMLQQGDVAGKRIVTLGDDDLASIALTLTGLPEQVTVLEIDPQLCEYIERASCALKLPIRVIEQDLTARLPTELCGEFDTFLCDPPETEAGLLLFVEKGLALLRSNEGRAGYFGATVLEASLNKWQRWQKRLLNNHQIAFTHILPPFTEYVSWPDEKPLPDLTPLSRISPRPWYRFAFYRLETLPSFLPPPDFDTERSELLYFDDESYYSAFTPR